MSETTILNCDICDEIFEPEFCNGHHLTYQDDENDNIQEMDICHKCFHKHILSLKKK